VAAFNSSQYPRNEVAVEGSPLQTSSKEDHTNLSPQQQWTQVDEGKLLFII
jgi:hypothetical protein